MGVDGRTSADGGVADAGAGSGRGEVCVSLTARGFGVETQIFLASGLCTVPPRGTTWY